MPSLFTAEIQDFVDHLVDLGFFEETYTAIYENGTPSYHFFFRERVREVFNLSDVGLKVEGQEIGVLICIDSLAQRLWSNYGLDINSVKEFIRNLAGR